MQQQDKSQYKRILVVQLVLTLALGAVAGLIDKQAAVSVLAGGGICTLAGALLAFWMFQPYRAEQAGLLVTRIYVAEIIKILFILVMFAIAYKLIEGLIFPILLAGYFVVQVAPVLIASTTGANSNKRN